MRSPTTFSSLARLLVASALLLVVAGCSSRTKTTGDAGPGFDGAPPRDASPDGAPSCDCVPGPHNDLLYVMSDTAELWSFDPRTHAFAFVAGPVCGGTSAPRPFSMAVDANGLAWILFIDSLDILTIDVKDPGACGDPGYNRTNPDFGLFGMAFVTQQPASRCERLYLHTYDGDGPFSEGESIGRLGVIDPITGDLTELALVDFDGGELAGTGDGRLFAFAGVDPVKLVEYDRATGSVIDILPLGGLTKTNASAFAFAGGDAWIFTEAPPPDCDPCLSAQCGEAYAACIADATCRDQLACAIELGRITDECGGGMPAEMMTCVGTTCRDRCLPSVRARVSRVSRLDFDGSDSPTGERSLTIVEDAAPIRIVGAGASTCVQTIPF